jgi:hypothetical protein
MAKIKYHVASENWSNVIATLDVIKIWILKRYTELDEDGDKYVLIDFSDDDLEGVFYTGILIGIMENNNKNNKERDK